jgi:hypothetical protein
MKQPHGFRHLAPEALLGRPPQERRRATLMALGHHERCRKWLVRIVYCLRSPSMVVAIFRMSSYRFSSRRAFRFIAARPPIEP